MFEIQPFLHQSQLAKRKLKFCIALVSESYFTRHIDILDNIVVTLQRSSGSRIWVVPNNPKIHPQCVEEYFFLTKGGAIFGCHFYQVLEWIILLVGFLIYLLGSILDILQFSPRLNCYFSLVGKVLQFFQ